MNKFLKILFFIFASYTIFCIANLVKILYDEIWLRNPNYSFQSYGLLLGTGFVATIFTIILGLIVKEKL